MLSRISVFTGFVLSAALFARADVVPLAPGPDMTYNVGSTCSVVWGGDKDSTTAWKSMAIELMTGSNLAMVHLTTVGTNLDGTTDGRLDYPCPDVTPNSDIYFYQLTATNSTSKEWTTRFTIASSTGATVPPTNATQPGSNDPIPWGTGALVDPSTAIAPPASAGGSDDAAASNTTSSASSAASGSVATGTSLPSGSTASRNTTSTLSSTGTGTANVSAPAQTVNSGAPATVVGNAIVLGSILALASSAVALGLSQ